MKNDVRIGGGQRPITPDRMKNDVRIRGGQRPITPDRMKNGVKPSPVQYRPGVGGGIGGRVGVPSNNIYQGQGGRPRTPDMMNKHQVIIKKK